MSSHVSMPQHDSGAGTDLGDLPTLSEEHGFIRFDNVQKQFTSRDRKKAPVVALDGVTFNVGKGEFVALIGPSGCGKSTLLNLVAGLTDPDSGQVIHGSRRVTGTNTDVGYVTQQDTLLPWLTVRGNVLLALKLRRTPRGEAEERVDAVLRVVGLSGFESHHPAQLSGGMRSRVMIARTLVYQPSTILMDEPFGNLDALLRLKMQEELAAIHRKSAATILYVTHDIEEAIALADRILVMSRRPATVLVEQSIRHGRPRDIRNDPDLVAMYEDVWSTLRDQIET